MIREKFEGVTENAYGQPIAPLKYSAEYDKFENIDEVRRANEFPKDSEIVDFINAENKANARQKAMVQSWTDAGIVKPTLENSEAKRFNDMVTILKAAGKSEAEAKTIAAATLNVNPDNLK